MSRFLLVLLCAACFGTGLTVSRLGLASFDVIDFTGLRFLVATAAFALYHLLRRGPPWPRERRFWLLAAGFGVTGTALPMLAIVGSLRYLSSGVAAVVAAVGPAFAVLFAHFLLSDERISGRKLLGIAIAFGGIAFLVVQRETGLGDPASGIIGYVMLLGGLLLSHASIVLARKYLRSYDLFQVVGVQMLAATVVVLPLTSDMLSMERVDHPWVAVSSVVYAGIVGTFAAFLSRFALIKRHGATDAALIDYVVPVMATTGGVLLLDEVLSSTMVVGMTIILVGVRVVQSSRRNGSNS
ncbi:MAG: DMT family transporter [Nannocystaceae bacterium]